MIKHQLNKVYFLFLSFFILFLATSCGCEVKLEWESQAVSIPAEDTDFPEISLDIITYSEKCPVIREMTACKGEGRNRHLSCNQDISFPNEPVDLWIKGLDAGGLASMEISILGGTLDEKDVTFSYSSPPPLQGKATWEGSADQAQNGKSFLGKLTPNKNFTERMIITVRARDFAGNETLHMLSMVFPRVNRVRR